jgi:hypothetical protein
MATPPKNVAKQPDLQAGNGRGETAGVQLLYFSDLLKRPVCAGSIRDRIGKLTDIVFSQSEPFLRRSESISSTGGASRPSSSRGTGW